MTVSASYVCKLVHNDRPFEPVEARVLSSGRLTLGRDPEADWTLEDEPGTLSRIHCTLLAEGGKLWLRDQSTNGTFFESGVRAPKDEAVELRGECTLRLGGFSLFIDPTGDPDPKGPPFTTIKTTLAAPVPPAPRDWVDQAPSPPTVKDGSLLEAFCEGAKLDASALSGEDPAQLMRRVGAIYQQTVLGLSALMANRARMKHQHDLDRTTIGACDNNPFKWSPTRRLAEDLLKGGGEGFLSDCEAVRACFDDLGRHLNAVAQGANAAAALATEVLEPASIEAEAKAQGAFFQSRSAACWQIHNRRFAALMDDGGAINQVFADAYDQSISAPER